MTVMAWTRAQQKVIDTRNKNLLVSAAAGSGKTAVLVERIISMISEGENPLDIDHLLVVTFTNAAAAEMRERIGKAIDAKLISEPDNQHLQKQLSLLQSAQITTIHSFCLYVIRNYFHRIDLDPSFKIAEESEITLMKSDVIADILEHWYDEGREDFHALIESYSYSKSDLPIEELVLSLYSFSMSAPWPEAWINGIRNMFDAASFEALGNTHWMKELLSYVDTVLGDLLNKSAEALALCCEPGGPVPYEAALMSDRKLLLTLKSAASYEEYSGLFAGITFERLSAKKDDSVLPWKKDRVKELREEVKKGLKDLTGQFFFQPPKEMLTDMQAVSGVMQVLFDLTLEFMEAFAAKKEEKNLIDFNDLEHFALKILVKQSQEGQASALPIPSEAALELRTHYDEILIDEYQDSNMVQETILKSISREDEGKPNRFMVGDVKQSIYKFRLAMPEIFMEKYGSYSCEDRDTDGAENNYQRIDLDKNFRSRKTVLDYVNKIFEQIMQASVGGIIYDAAAALKYGELYEETIPAAGGDISPVSAEIAARIAQEVELLLVTEEEGLEMAASSFGSEERMTGAADGDAASKADEEEAIYTKKELEARSVARRIRELTDPETGMLVFDQKTKKHRPAAYKDIVILLRSMSGWSEVFVNTLMQEGIPAHADTGTGYFQTLEIMAILNMLRIIDNPRQDIPLTGVLYSPMVGLTSTELALLKAGKRNVSMYTAMLDYVQQEQSPEEAGNSDRSGLLHKLESFLLQLNTFRAMVNHKPIHELLQLVLDQTGYYYYVSAMPGGEQRKANIDMLVSQAVRFEKGSYSGLFHFIRYMEKLHKYEVDFGEAATSGEQDNTVRIMSIHKSKGLEFPIVIAGGMSKQFNTQDLRSSIVLHSELGVGPEYIDCSRRTKVPTLLKKVIQKKVQIENLGEELRVLYVAMTRAKEKLILSGYLNSREELVQKDYSFFELLSAKSYLDWVLPAMLNRIGMPNQTEGDSQSWSSDGMIISIINKEELLAQEINKQIFLLMDAKELEGITTEQVYDSELKSVLEERLKFSYPYQKEAGLKVKMTVSELKKLGQFQDEEQSVNLYPDNEPAAIAAGSIPSDTKHENSTSAVTIPAFLRETQEVIAGTDRGTLYHRVLELIDLMRIGSREDLQKELNCLIRDNKIKGEDIEKLKFENIYQFTRSDIARRMRKAQASNHLFKEKQFVIGRKASEVIKDSESEELVLIQGIIDVFFEEEGELVLLDYKSDLVEQEEQLVKRYQVQLEYYKKALEQMLKKRVKEMVIYSLPLAKEIRIEA